MTVCASGHGLTRTYGDVTATIVGQPLDGDQQAIDQPDAMLDGSDKWGPR
jgi:hypothetical protein